MKTITVKASEIVAALESAKRKTQDWQAGLLEMLIRIPALHERWNEINKRSDLRVEEVPGATYLNYTREQNMAVEDWSVMMGYIFHLGVIRYNSVREDGYMHSASCAWDGVQRRTRCGWLELLRMLTFDALGEMEVCLRAMSPLKDAQVEFVDDLTVPLMSVYVETTAGPGVWYLRNAKASEDRVLKLAVRYKGKAWNSRVALIPFDRNGPPCKELTALPEQTWII